VSKIDENNMSALAHRELQQHRELREMVRLAAWEMPLLSQYTTPFQPPREDQILKWRYTTYLGETHPAARKVVVEFEPARIPDLTPEQLSKLLKIAGPRYNPSTKIIKMSTDSFETQAQNKRYLAETINNLIAECRDPNADSFADVPLDTRHHRPKPRYKFPEVWIMTPERRAELEAKRKASMLEEAKKIEEDRLVHGLRAIEEARKVDAAKVEEPLMANARQSLPSGKMGKREMGQKPNARR
jgi:small subunit ribosomal protein S35